MKVVSNLWATKKKSKKKFFLYGGCRSSSKKSDENCDRLACSNKTYHAVPKDTVSTSTDAKGHPMITADVEFLYS